MAKKSKSHHDDSNIDDEPEADWTEDTEAEGRSPEAVLASAPPAEHEERAPDIYERAMQPQPPQPMPGEQPPVTRESLLEELQAFARELRHTAVHNGPIMPSTLAQLDGIAAKLQKLGSERMG